MTERAHISPEDLSLFAMQALSPDEAAAVRAHVESCQECRNELVAATGDLALAAMSAEQHAAPEGARQRLAHRIAADAEATHRAPGANVTSIDSARPVRRVYQSVQWSAVAAMLVFSVALLLKNGATNRELKEKSQQLEQVTAANARAQQVLDLLTSKQAQHVVLTAANTHPVPSGRAVYLASTGGLYFQASNLTSIAANKTYELWVIPAKAFGVTLEDAQGAQTPTMPILLAGAAPSAGE